jgi:adenine phosphoribosyltransferase
VLPGERRDARPTPETRAGYRDRVPIEAPSAADLARAESLIAITPDFPTPGINFRDITPLLADAGAFRAVIDGLLAPFEGTYDVVAGIEARGFLLAAAAAVAGHAGLVPIRKAGKLPRPAASVDYALEYATATIEMHDDIAPGTRVLLIDDVLATGGTIAAAQGLVERLGGTVAGTAVLLELTALGGRALTGDVHALFTV